jgi:hypothetical protein
MMRFGSPIVSLGQLVVPAVAAGGAQTVEAERGVEGAFDAIDRAAFRTRRNWIRRGLIAHSGVNDSKRRSVTAATCPASALRFGETVEPVVETDVNLNPFRSPVGGSFGP